MDRDGMYVLVRPSETLIFQLDYRMNKRRETVTFGKYGPSGPSLARARELCVDAKRAIAEGRSPAIEKQQEKRPHPGGQELRRVRRETADERRRWPTASEPCAGRSSNANCYPRCEIGF